MGLISKLCRFRKKWVNETSIWCYAKLVFNGFNPFYITYIFIGILYVYLSVDHDASINTHAIHLSTFCNITHIAK